MSACAGSLTEVPREGPGREFTALPLADSEWSGSRERFLNIRRPGPDGSQPGRIGFMSTQRREESRPRRTKCIHSAVLPAWFHNGNEDSWPEGLERRSEKSLRADYRTKKVRLGSSSGLRVRRRITACRPLRTGSRTVNLRSFNPAFPAPAVFLRLHPSSPLIPARLLCRAERYDGKRDLYFQHAARNAACDS